MLYIAYFFSEGFGDKVAVPDSWRADPIITAPNGTASAYVWKLAPNECVSSVCFWLGEEGE